MKKILLSLLLLVCVTSVAMAQYRRQIYVNPLQNNSELSSTTANRLYKKGMLGLTKSRSIAVTRGEQVLPPGQAAGEVYDYILTFTIDNADAVDVRAELKDAVKEIAGIFGSKSNGSSTNDKPNYQATISTTVTIVNAATGEKVYETDLVCSASNEDKNLGWLEATGNYDLAALDMADDAFTIIGEVLEAVEVDKKGKVKKVRVQAGSNNGARKDLWFDLYMNVGGQKTFMGNAKCEQVLNGEESVLSVTSKKDGDKALNEALSNLDGSYTITAESRAKGGFMRKNLKTFDKIKFKSERPSYLDPAGRGTKAKVAFYNIEAASSTVAPKDLMDMVLHAANKAAGIEVVPTLYSSVDAAREAGIDGLIEVSVDMMQRSSEQKKNYKGEPYTEYKSKMYYSISGIDVAGNKQIDMLSKYELGNSSKTAADADTDALNDAIEDVQHFCEDVFPISCNIMEALKTNEKKQEVKEASIDAGTAMGVDKGMIFDIFEQRSEGGDDARFLIGEGKVKGGLDLNECVISIKGKNDGDKKLFDLIKNLSEDTEIILISKANHGFGGFLDNIVGNN